MSATPPPDPLGPARSVAAPAISELLDRHTGGYVDASAWIGAHLYQALIRDRVGIVEWMNAGDPHFLCPNCSIPVYLISRPGERVFYFRHIRGDGWVRDEAFRARGDARRPGPDGQVARPCCRCLCGSCPLRPAYRSTPRTLPLMHFLFSEIAAKVEVFWAKADMAPTVSA